jgi:hypothetical protein
VHSVSDSGSMRSVDPNPGRPKLSLKNKNKWRNFYVWRSFCWAGSSFWSLNVFCKEYSTCFWSQLIISCTYFWYNFFIENIGYGSEFRNSLDLGLNSEKYLDPVVLKQT